MKKYELMLVLKSEQDLVKSGIDKVKNLISENGGSVESEKDYGAKVLAYEIKKENHAHYYLLNVKVAPDKLKPIQDEFEFVKELLRYLFVTI